MKAALITIGLIILAVFGLFLYSCLMIAARDVDDNELFCKEVDSDGDWTEGSQG